MSVSPKQTSVHSTSGASESQGSDRPNLIRIFMDRFMPVIIILFIYGPAITTLAEAYRDGTPVLTLVNKTLTALFIGLALVLFVVRHDTKGKRASLIGRIVAIAGTFGAGLFALNAQTEPRPALEGVAIAIQIVGLSWAIVSLAFLGRSFGVFPEARGLVRRGPYRVVRHPLYLGEILIFLGALLPAFSLMAIFVFLLASGLQVWRTVYEERALRRAFPDEYGEYAAQTDRLIPGVW